MKHTWSAVTYHYNSHFQYQSALTLLHANPIPAHANVLDVGCGDGKITADIAKIAYKGNVLGIDRSSTMIEFAKNTFEMNYSNLTFKACCAESISYIDCFDYIVSFSCLHWVKNQLEFLIRAKKALKRMGKMILLIYGKHPILWDAIDQTTMHAQWRSYFSNWENPHITYNKRIYENLCQLANLKVLSIKEHETIATFQQANHFQDFIFSWLPHTSRLPESLRLSYIKNICETVVQHLTKQSSQQIEVPFIQLEILIQNTAPSTVV